MSISSYNSGVNHQNHEYFLVKNGFILRLDNLRQDSFYNKLNLKPHYFFLLMFEVQITMK